MLLRRLVITLSRLTPVAVCALATHALVYRTLWPSDGVHGYFGWYEPAVVAMSLASLAGLLGFVAVAWVARHSGRPLRPIARGNSPNTFAATARSLGASSLVFLLVQESVERSVEAGHPALQVFTPSEWLVLLGGLAATSVLLAVGLRLTTVVVGRVLASAPPRAPGHRQPTIGWSVATFVWRRLRPLAERFALRAPPLAMS
jgi:hypothetical protein